MILISEYYIILYFVNFLTHSVPHIYGDLFFLFHIWIIHLCDVLEFHFIGFQGLKSRMYYSIFLFLVLQNPGMSVWSFLHFLIGYYKENIINFNSYEDNFKNKWEF